MTSKNLAVKLGCTTALVGAAIPAALVLNWMREPFGSAYVVQSREALTQGEAKRLSGLPFPDSARNIRYAHFRHWIAHETFARFEAPEADCVAFAEKLIVSSNPAQGQSRPVKVQVSALSLPIDRSVTLSQNLETGWFDLQSIRQGLECGSGPGHSPKVWIDSERGVCYYKQTD